MSLLIQVRQMFSCLDQFSYITDFRRRDNAWKNACDIIIRTSQACSFNEDSKSGLMSQACLEPEILLVKVEQAFSCLDKLHQPTLVEGVKYRLPQP